MYVYTTRHNRKRGKYQNYPYLSRDASTNDNSQLHTATSRVFRHGRESRETPKGSPARPLRHNAGSFETRYRRAECNFRALFELRAKISGCRKQRRDATAKPERAVIGVERDFAGFFHSFSPTREKQRNVE